jgi:hypothetical protein
MLKKNILYFCSQNAEMGSFAVLGGIRPVPKPINKSAFNPFLNQNQYTKNIFCT